MTVCNREDIQALFDVHIEAIMQRIKQRLEWLRDEGHFEQVVSSSSVCDTLNVKIRIRDT